MKFFHTCLLLALLLLNALPSKAVLQEDSLKNSLAVLRHELITSHYQLNEQTTRAKQLNSRVTQQLKDITQRSSQVSLMLYSQNSEYIFDVTYACHQATTLYNEFETKTRPFSILVERSKQDIARYDSLINSLSTMYTEGMTEREKIDRNVCLTLAVSIRRMLTENNRNFQDYIQYYNYTRKQLKELNDYAQKRYQDIQGSLLRNTNENYFSILLHPQYYILRMVVAYKDKYVPDNKVKSQWDASWLLLLLAMVAFYGLCAVLVNFLSIRFLATRLIKSNRWHIDAKAFLTKRTCIIINGTVHHLWSGAVVDTLYLAVQLCLYGDGHPAGVYLAAGGHLHLADAPRGWRTHPQHLPQLLPHHLRRCGHYLFPHHLDSGRLCQHNAAAAHAHCHPMAGPYHQEIPTAGDAQ